MAGPYHTATRNERSSKQLDRAIKATRIERPGRKVADLNRRLRHGRSNCRTGQEATWPSGRAFRCTGEERRATHG